TTAQGSSNMNLAACTPTATNSLSFYILTVTPSPSSEGTVSPTGGSYQSGSTVAITATPTTGYAFTGWAGAGTGSYSGASNPASVTMNSNIIETASFQPIPETLTINNNGCTSVSGTGTYNYG